MLLLVVPWLSLLCTTSWHAGIGITYTRGWLLARPASCGALDAQWQRISYKSRCWSWKFCYSLLWYRRVHPSTKTRQKHTSYESRLTRRWPKLHWYSGRLPSESTQNQTYHSRHVSSGVTAILTAHQLNIFIRHKAFIPNAKLSYTTRTYVNHEPYLRRLHEYITMSD